MQAVNLLPADARVSRSAFSSLGGQLPARRTLQIGGAVTVLLAVLIVGGFVHERSVVHGDRSTLANDQARLVAVQAQVTTIKAAQEEASSRLGAIEAVVGSRMDWDRTMGDLARILPTDIVLTGLQATAPVTAATESTNAAAAATADTSTPTAPAAPTTSTLTMSGIAPSYVRIAAVLDQLSLLPWLSDVTLTAAAKQAGGTATFSVTANVSEVH